MILDALSIITLIPLALRGVHPAVLGEFAPGRLAADFGTAADPGANHFRCNSSPNRMFGGGDVRISVSNGAPAAFVGNSWDHVPPSQSKANGADLAFQSDGSGSVGASSASPAEGTAPRAAPPDRHR